MKRYIFLAGLCFASSLLGSMVTVAFLPAGPEVVPVADLEAAEIPEFVLPDVLRVSKILLVDERGKTRLELAANVSEQGDAAAAITLYDKYGVRKFTLGIDAEDDPFLMMENSDLPNIDHKRITIAVDKSTARLEMGHAEMSEILIQSARPSDTSDNRIELQARNSSKAGFYVSEYGHASLEVVDNATQWLVQVPERREQVLE